RLGDELGAGAASLYWHVGSKDGLLDLVLDEIIGEHQVPDPDPARWQEQLKEVARHQRRVTLRHPYVVRISIGRIPMGPNALQYSERVLAILRAGGLPPRPDALAWPRRAGWPGGRWRAGWSGWGSSVSPVRLGPGGSGLVTPACAARAPADQRPIYPFTCGRGLWGELPT